MLTDIKTNIKMEEQLKNSSTCQVLYADKLADKLINITISESREGVLVTGGAGFIGSYVAAALLKRRRKVILFDIFNQETSGSDEKHNNVLVLKKIVKEVNEKLTSIDIKAELYVIIGDIRDRHSINEVINNPLFNVTSAIHAAAMVDHRRSISSSKEYFDVNIRGTAILLDMLGKSGKIKRVVQASSSSVFGEVYHQNTKLDEDSPRRPLNPYGVSQVASDALAHCYSHIYQMQVFLIRIPSCFGHGANPNMFLRILMEKIANGEFVKKFGTGEATRTWLYIDDIVDCFMKAFFYGLRESNSSAIVAMNKPPLSLYEEFNTGSQEGSLTLNRVIETAEKVMGKKANIQMIKAVPKGNAKFSGIYDYSKAKRVLGWEPQYTLEEGMRGMNKHYSDANIDKHPS